jgi:hypothetical protein
MIRRIAAAAAILSGLVSGAAQAADYTMASLNTGAMGLRDKEVGGRSGEMELQFHGKPFWWKLAPQAGFQWGFKGSTYTWAGLEAAFALNSAKTWYLTPSEAFGLWTHGGFKDLGYPLEFRSAIELSHRFPNDMQMGVQFYHISNAGIGERNPGIEGLLLTIGIPLGSRPATAAAK